MIFQFFKKKLTLDIDIQASDGVTITHSGVDFGVFHDSFGFERRPYGHPTLEQQVLSIWDVEESFGQRVCEG